MAATRVHSEWTTAAAPPPPDGAASPRALFVRDARCVPPLSLDNAAAALVTALIWLPPPPNDAASRTREGERSALARAAAAHRDGDRDTDVRDGVGCTHAGGSGSDSSGTTSSSGDAAGRVRRRGLHLEDALGGVLQLGTCEALHAPDDRRRRR